MPHQLICILLALIFTANAFAHEPHAPGEDAETKGEIVPAEELLEAAAEIAKQVADIRGLPLQKEIKKGIKRRDELRELLIARLAEEIEEEAIVAEGKVYKRLGLIPDDLDYKQMMLDLLTEQIAGFYDPKAKELYIMEGLPLTLQRPALAHELFHAIQDQHFDILALQEPFTSLEHGDFALARLALIEGDATVVMLDFSLYDSGALPQRGATSVVDLPPIAGLLKTLSFDDLTSLEALLGGSPVPDSPELGDSVLASAPSFFREMLIFPYFAGMRFIVALRTQRTWEDINQVYRNPPVSTEQILHPEKYMTQDMPDWLDFDDAGVLQGYDPIYDTVMGELQMLLYLRQHVPRHMPAVAAEGWGGDRLKAWEKDDQVLVVHLSSWDSWKDAQEYYDALSASLRTRHPKARETTQAAHHGQSSCFQDQQQRHYVERWADMVLHIEGAPSNLDPNGRELDSTVFRLRQAVWNTQMRTPFEKILKDRKDQTLKTD